VGVRL